MRISTFLPKIWFFAAFFWISIVHAQTPTLDLTNLEKLRPALQARLTEYKKRALPNYKSLGQTTGTYFSIKTKNPAQFLADVHSAGDVGLLMKKYKRLELDRSLLVVKYVTSGGGKTEIQYYSPTILGRSYYHVSIPKVDFEPNHKIVFNQNAIDSAYYIYGFYLDSGFVATKIPSKYADWINYCDILCEPEQPLFFNAKPMARFGAYDAKNPLNKLHAFFNKATKMPVYGTDDYAKRYNTWHAQRKTLSDSLYHSSVKFRQLIKRGYSYALEKGISSEDVEDFTAWHVSVAKALQLARQRPLMGSCSMDDSPLWQQVRMANMAASVGNWSVFIKTYLNTQNDKVSRVAESSMGRAGRVAEVSELMKFNFDILKLMFGAVFEIGNEMPHYKGYAFKLAQAFHSADKNTQAKFKNMVLEAMGDAQLDAYNRLIMNQVYRSCQSLATQKDASFVERYKAVSATMPTVIKNRLFNPNYKIYQFLHAEQSLLDKFTIHNYDIGEVYSSVYTGERWSMKLSEKQPKDSISFWLTMPIDTAITPFSNFFKQYQGLLKTVRENTFLMNLLKAEKGGRLNIEFFKDGSFNDYKISKAKNLPENIKKLNFTGAINLYLTRGMYNDAELVLLGDKKVLVLTHGQKFALPGLELQNIPQKKEIYEDIAVNKLFDERGEILN